MPTKHEKIAEIFKRFWANRVDADGHYGDFDKAEFQKLGAEAGVIITDADIVEILTQIPRGQRNNHELLLWIKTRELKWKRSAARETRPGGTATMAAFSDGAAMALHDVWSQILFPGVSVQDGTLDPETAAKAEEEWTAIAEEVLKNKMGKVLPEKTEEELKEEKRAKLQEELTEAARRNFRC